MPFHLNLLILVEGKLLRREGRLPFAVSDDRRDCQPTRASGRIEFDNVGLAIGEKALNFTLRDTHGSEVRLSQLLTGKPAVKTWMFLVLAVMQSSSTPGRAWAGTETSTIATASG